MKKSKEKAILKEMGIEEKSNADIKEDEGIVFNPDKLVKQGKNQDNDKDEIDDNTPVSGMYRCPQCGYPLKSRKEVCPKCGYSGYIQMTKKQITIIRVVLFVILMVVFLIYWFVFRNK